MDKKEWWLGGEKNIKTNLLLLLLLLTLSSTRVPKKHMIASEETTTRVKTKRRLVLVKAEEKEDEKCNETPVELCERFLVGSHVPIQTKELERFLKIYADMDPKKPYQIFLGSPQMSRMNISDTQIEGGGKVIRTNGLGIFVHSQYIINLSASFSDFTAKTAPTSSAKIAPTSAWNTNLLAQNLKYATSLGCRGVVVHVGKSTKLPYQIAIQNMRQNIETVLSFATSECPLLLETPAGQGTETLKKQEEFIEFVESFGGDPRLRVCLDTCHVFACGHDPIYFIGSLLQKNLLHLVHFNDSKEPCGSCKDRHAFVGSGHIGQSKMAEIAKLCCSRGIPMVIE